MNEPTRSPAWHALERHAERLSEMRTAELFELEPRRAERFTLRFEDWVADFSKQRYDLEAWEALTRLAHDAGVPAGIRRMAGGEPINLTERRAALHVALRSAKREYSVDGAPVTPGVQVTLASVLELAAKLRAGEVQGAAGTPIRRVVNLGIGGSDLGPRMAAHALADPRDAALAVDFVANVDPAELDAVLARADARETAFIVSSKSFSTIETLTNARSARDWLAAQLGSPEAAGAQLYAVSNNLEAAAELGIAPERCFELPEWVGGRFSMWSAIGLPLACAIGPAAFRELLEGACDMDEHFLFAPVEANLPVWMALAGIWNTNFMNAESHAVLPYSARLAELPAYLQQLEMESNGKSVTRQGRPVGWQTAPVLWGGAGTVGQHAFHQLMYQGTRIIPADFIVPVDTDTPAQRTLVGNALAQAAALMAGKSEEQARDELQAKGESPEEIERLAPHMACRGNQPSTTLLFPKLDARALGRLIALYEHKVFVQGWIWGINSFDQYGVELGKQMARRLDAGGAGEADPSTAALMQAVAAMRTQG